MKMISRLNIGARLTLGFGLMLLCAATLLGIGLWRMGALQGDTEHIVGDRLTSLNSVLGMRDSGASIALALRQLAAPTDAKEGAEAGAKLSAALAGYADADRALPNPPVDPAGLGAVRKGKDELMPVIAQLRSTVAAGNYFDAALLLKTDFAPRHAAWMGHLRGLADAERAAMTRTGDASRVHYRAALAGMLVVGLLTLVFGAACAWYITRSISVPLRRAARVADRIAGGDLQVAIDADAAGEAGQLLRALKLMQTRLSEAMARITEGSAAVLVTARDMAAGNTELSARTERQAGSLRQTAALIDQMAATVRENAEHARQTSVAGGTALHCATGGSAVAARVSATMGAIKASSDRVFAIVSVIDAIAFQSNILALNAAVEAARAGEAGRGFAVVAAEVRALAHRSAGAAREIKSLIDISVEQVGQGYLLVDEAAEAMRQIVASVQQVAGLAHSISAASAEQSDSIEQISHAIDHMDAITQKNAALVQQAAASAEALSGQSARLAQAVSRFKLEDEGPGRRPPARLASLASA